MGITDFLDKRNRKRKMKLIAASVFALAAADERAFADKNEFITAQESWWYNQWWAGDDKPAEYFANHTSSNGAKDQFTNKMATNMNNLVVLAKNLNKRCTNQGKPEYANLMAAQAGRKRRSGSKLYYRLD